MSLKFETTKIFSTINNDRWFEEWFLDNWEPQEDEQFTFQISDPEESDDDVETKRFYREAIEAGAKVGEFVVIVYEQ